MHYKNQARQFKVRNAIIDLVMHLPRNMLINKEQEFNF